MTIGIVVTFKDGALLVADGRQVRPLVPDAPPLDDVNKIFQVHPTMAAVTFGVQQASESALRNLKVSLTQMNNFNPHDVGLIVENSVTFGWSTFLSRLSPDVDLGHPALKVGLVVGGLADGVPFVAGSLKSVSGGNSVIDTGAGKFIVLGGEDQNARADFDSRSKFNKTVNDLLNSAREAIQLAAFSNKDIGGIVHYAILQRSGQYTTGHF